MAEGDYCVTTQLQEKFNPDVENIEEFMERFLIQNDDLLEKAGKDNKKKVSLLMKNLPVTIITDLQRRIKPLKLSDMTFTDITNKLESQFITKRSIIGATVRFLNRKQQPEESIESYAKALNELCSECEYSDCCRCCRKEFTIIAF